MSDDKRMICASIESGIDPVPNSMPTNCCGCGRGLWISQGSIEANPDADPWCFACVLPDILAGEAEESDQPEAKVMLDAIRRGYRPQGEPLNE